jgi:hypothetical protein
MLSLGGWYELKLREGMHDDAGAAMGRHSVESLLAQPIMKEATQFAVSQSGLHPLTAAGMQMARHFNLMSKGPTPFDPAWFHATISTSKRCLPRYFPPPS